MTVFILAINPTDWRLITLSQTISIVSYLPYCIGAYITMQHPVSLSRIVYLHFREIYLLFVRARETKSSLCRVFLICFVASINIFFRQCTYIGLTLQFQSKKTLSDLINTDNITQQAHCRPEKKSLKTVVCHARVIMLTR